MVWEQQRHEKRKNDNYYPKIPVTSLYRYSRYAPLIQRSSAFLSQNICQTKFLLSFPVGHFYDVSLWVCILLQKTNELQDMIKQGVTGGYWGQIGLKSKCLRIQHTFLRLQIIFFTHHILIHQVMLKCTSNIIYTEQCLYIYIQAFGRRSYPERLTVSTGTFPRSKQGEVPCPKTHRHLARQGII